MRVGIIRRRLLRRTALQHFSSSTFPRRTRIVNLLLPHVRRLRPAREDIAERDARQGWLRRAWAGQIIATGRNRRIR